jgi:hypothetical protein
MRKLARIVSLVVVGLVVACGAKAGKVTRDAAIDLASETGAGTGGATVTGTGGTGTGGAGTGGATVTGAGGAGTGGASGGITGSGGAGGTDGGIDGALSSCEKSGDTCVPLTGDCVVCPDESFARWSQTGCPGGTWCCTRNIPADNPCTDQGGICGSTSPSCPTGWVAMRTSCGSGSSATCCMPSSACRP